jgi:CheY-specific phosphatase CheX
VVEDIRQSAVRAVSKVFEEMFFIFPEELGESPGAKGGEAQGGGEEDPSAGSIRAEIEFNGVPSGKIILILPVGLARKMTGNLMGMDEGEVGEPEILDMVGELNNMISGNLFFLLKRKGEYRLTKTKAERVSAAQAQTEPQDGRVEIHFSADGERVKLTIHLEP